MSETETQTVYVTIGCASSWSRRRYHRDPDCRFLDKANGVTSKPRSVLPEDAQVCSGCGAVSEAGDD